MGFEEGEKGREQRRVADAAPQLVRPDSGQIEEPARPPLLAERCGKRGKGKRQRIGWSLGLHGLEVGQLRKEANWRRS